MWAGKDFKFFWTPTQQNIIDRIETIQRRFLRALFYRLPWSRDCTYPSYRTRCLLFRLESLQYRRMMAQCVYLHKLLCGSIDAPSILEHVDIRAPSRILRSRPLFCTNFISAEFVSMSFVLPLSCIVSY